MEVALDDAVAWLARGGLVAYPTETVWGLGADATRADAVARLRAWKGREADQPISLLVDDAASLADLGIRLTPLGRRLVAAFWPGPLTLVVPCAHGFAPGVARSDGAVGVRCSPHPLAAALARRLHEVGVGPVTATSLNRHGEPPARNEAEARALCGSAGDPGAPTLVAAGGPDAGGSATSTVVDLTGATPRVLRQGALGAEALEPWLGPERARA